MNRSVSWNLAGLAAFACLILPAPLAATATAVSTSSATITIAVLDIPGGNPIPPPAGLTITAQAAVDFQTVVEQSGINTLVFNGSATASGSGSSTRLDYTTDVQATADPAGKAHGAENLGGHIQFVNGSNQDLQIATWITYDYSNSSTVGNPAAENAQTIFTFDLILGGADCGPVQLLDLHESTAAPPDDVSGPTADTQAFTFPLSTGNDCVVLASAQSIALAEAAAAAPVMPPLMLVILGVLLVSGGVLLLRSLPAASRR